MSELGDFYGVSIELENTISLFRGYSIEFSENLVIRFFNSFGDSIERLDELELNIDGVVNTIENIEGGEISLFVESQSSFNVKATSEGEQGFESFIHPGGDVNLVIEIRLLTPPCKEDRSINYNNFYHFSRVNNVKIQDINSMSFCSCERGVQDYLPNGFLRNNLCYIPIISPNEEFSIQVNFKDSDYINREKVRIAIMRGYDIVRDNFLIVNEVGVNDQDKNYYFSYTPNELFLSEACNYRFILYDENTNDVLLISNYFEFSKEGHQEETIYLEYRHSSNRDNYVYSELPNFKNKVRIHLNEVDSNGEYEIKEYFEQTTENIRIQKNRSKKVLKLESFFFDEYAHDAMRSLSVHDDIQINGKEVKIKKGYDTSKNRKNSLNIGTVEFYDQAFSKININGKI